MRRRRSLSAAGVLCALLFLSTAVVDPSTAAGRVHPDAHAHSPDHDHLAQDLAGTPMRTIEARTAENAARVERATGVRPGKVRAKVAAADPGKSGSWSPVVD